MKWIVTSGGFDPLHIGHIFCLREARELGDALMVIVNTDEFLMRKKGFIFMPFEERLAIVCSLKFVTQAIKSVDDDQTVCETLRLLRLAGKCDVFAKGGDRTFDNTPERDLCKELGIEMVFKVGGGKVCSSSGLVLNFVRGFA